MQNCISDNSSIDSLLDHHLCKAIIDEMLIDLIDQEDNDALKILLKDALFPGRRLRPTLLMILSRGICLNLDSQTLNNLCLSVELCHRASIISDDFIDSDISRRKQNAFYVDYGAEKTLIMSHYLVSIAYRKMQELLCDPKGDLLSLFVDAYGKICLGEFGDVGGLSGKSYFDLYKKIILYKTSSLYELIFGWLACLARKNDSEINLYLSIGKKIGELYQVFNDVYDDIEASIYERGYKKFYKINLTLMNCIVLDFGQEIDKEFLQSIIGKKSSCEKYLKAKSIYGKKDYKSIASDYIGVVSRDLESLVMRLQESEVRDKVFMFTKWLCQKKCWNQNEYYEAGY